MAMHARTGHILRAPLCTALTCSHLPLVPWPPLMTHIIVRPGCASGRGAAVRDRDGVPVACRHQGPQAAGLGGPGGGAGGAAT